MEKHFTIGETAAVAAILRSEELAASNLLDSEILAAHELLDSETLRAAEFKVLYMRLLSEAQNHREIMGWMSGQYSVDASVYDDSAEREFDIAALDLRIAQEKKAINLKKAQSQAAIELKDFQKDRASFQLKDS